MSLCWTGRSTSTAPAWHISRTTCHGFVALLVSSVAAFTGGSHQHASDPARVLAPFYGVHVIMNFLATIANLYRVHIGSRPFFKHVAVVASGSVLTQAVALLFTPIVTRLYGPAAYGIQGLFSTIVVVLATAVAFSYPLAIMSARDDGEIRGFFKISIALSGVIALLMLAAAPFFGKQILASIDSASIDEFMYLVPPAVFISVLSVLATQWTTRKRLFLEAAKINVFFAFLTGAGKVALSYFSSTALVLIVVGVAGSLLNSLALLAALRKKMRASSPADGSSIEPDRLLALAARYKDFALFRTPQNLINVLGNSLPVLLLATYFGPRSVAFYSLASAVLILPVGIIGGSVIQVFQPRINEAIHAGENVRRLLLQATLGVGATALVPILIIVFFGPRLFAIAFGDDWKMAGTYAQCLSIWLFFQHLNKPVVAAIPALGLQRGQLVQEIFSTLSKALALWGGYFFFKSEIVAIALFSAMGSVYYFGLIGWVFGHSKKRSTSNELKKELA